MTSSELARDKLKYWRLIDRAKKVKFPIPKHWMKYGLPPTNETEIVNICLEAITDKFLHLFDSDDFFYKQIKSK